MLDHAKAWAFHAVGAEEMGWVAAMEGRIARRPVALRVGTPFIDPCPRVCAEMRVRTIRKFAYWTFPPANPERKGI